VTTLAISKEQKEKLVAQYQRLLEQSQAAFIAEYSGLNMKNIDELRGKVREIGGEFHVVKNTLGRLALKALNISAPEYLFRGSTAIGFIFNDPPGLAKVLNAYAQANEAFKIKGGFLNKRAISSAEVQMLASLPTQDVLRAQLIGVIQAPATKLVRLLAEPGRQVAAVLQAHAERLKQ
jgi:large subunit ribosomal protein L10